MSRAKSRAAPKPKPERGPRIGDAVRAAIDAVENIGAPENMSKAEYREFLGRLIADLGICLEAVEGELRSEGER